MLQWFSFDCTTCSHSAVHEVACVAELASKDLKCQSKEAGNGLIGSQSSSTVSALDTCQSTDTPSDKASESHCSDIDVFSPASPEFQAEPLEEDLAIFEDDARRFAEAQQVLDSFRERVDKEFLNNRADELARKFCTDSTLIRYLCAASCCQDKALEMLSATVTWRASYLSKVSICQQCLDDPRAHCFLHLGKDSMQRNVIYSCAGRASNKSVANGVRHMALELDRIFEGNKEPGSIVFVVDFAGFGLSDCNPHIGMLAIPLFANHYPERFSQVVLMSMPSVFRFFLKSAMKHVDPIMQKKVLVLNGANEQKRYADAYWASNPTMANWFEAVKDCKCQPGCYPDATIHPIEDRHTQAFLQRCCKEHSKQT
jgi:hypothetical protein